MKLTISRKLSLSFTVALIFTLIIGAVSYFSITKLRDTAGWVDHTHEVLGELLQIESGLKDAETGQRGFLLTGEERYLEPYLAARTKVDTAIQNVRRLTSDNPQQQQRIGSMEPLVASKFGELAQTIELRRGQGFDAALEVVLTDAGKQVMDDIRKIITSMSSEETQLLGVRDKEAEASAIGGKRTIVFGN